MAPVDDRRKHPARKGRNGPAKRQLLNFDQHAAVDLHVTPVQLHPPEEAAVVADRPLALVRGSGFIELSDPRRLDPAPGPIAPRTHVFHRVFDVELRRCQRSFHLPLRIEL